MGERCYWLDPSSQGRPHRPLEMGARATTDQPPFGTGDLGRLAERVKRRRHIRITPKTESHRQSNVQQVFHSTPAIDCAAFRRPNTRCAQSRERCATVGTQAQRTLDESVLWWLFCPLMGALRN